MKYAVLNILTVILLVPSQCRTQPVDSILLRSFQNRIEFLETVRRGYSFFETSFRRNNTNTVFCHINAYYPEEGSRLLELYLLPGPIPKYVTYRFLVEKYWCLTKDQKHRIIGTLNTTLKPTDPYFHQLVSLYRLDFGEFLAAHRPNPQDLPLKIQAEMKIKGRVTEETQFRMKNMAALTNLGERHLEDTLLNIVHTVYSNIKETGRRHSLHSFYLHVVSSTVAILNSKSSVLKTLYLLDEDDNGYSGPDVGSTNFVKRYFDIAIAPKLKDHSFDQLFWPGNEVDIEKLKERIRNDDSIWHEHIR
jgi:hypothetical protein